MPKIVLHISVVDYISVATMRIDDVELEQPMIEVEDRICYAYLHRKMKIDDTDRTSVNIISKQLWFIKLLVVHQSRIITENSRFCEGNGAK